MFLKEAIWVNNILKKIKDIKNKIVFDFGSSTDNYRRTIQPYIEKYIFSYLKNQRTKIIHIDKKKEKDIFNWDLEKPNIDGLIEKIGRADVVLALNLLEHVKKRDLVLDYIRKCTKIGGIIIITVPYNYIFHPDPIDTLFRPSPFELEMLFSKDSYFKISSRLIEDRLAKKVFIPSINKKIIFRYKVSCLAVKKINE